ncbi:MAG: class I SAM-dependent methyltransferase [Nitrososphaerota archaeon]
MIQKYNISSPLLDLGCGDGVRTRLIFDKDFVVHGVDNDPEMIEFARRRLDKAYLGNMEDPPPEILNNKYGTILIMESLEHVRNPEKVLRLANELLTDDGVLLVIVPLNTLLFRLIWWIWTRTMGKKWKHLHIHNFKSPKQLFILLERWFRVVEYKRTNFGCILIAICKKR